MKNRIKFYLVIVITFATAIQSSHSGNSEALINGRLKSFPLAICEWNGQNLIMDDYVYQSLETPYFFVREYSRERTSDRVNLAVVWFDDTNIAFHTPENCLGGVGNTVKDQNILHYDNSGRYFELKRLLVEHNSRKAIVLYYFDTDGYMTTSQAKLRLRILMRRLLSKRSSAAFVRLMAPVQTSEADALNLLFRFLDAISPLMPNYLYCGENGPE